MAPSLCSSAPLQAEIGTLQRSRANPSRPRDFGPRAAWGWPRASSSAHTVGQGPGCLCRAAQGPLLCQQRAHISCRGYRAQQKGETHYSCPAWERGRTGMPAAALAVRPAATPVPRRAARTSSPGPTFAPAKSGGAFTSGNHQ